MENTTAIQITITFGIQVTLALFWIIFGIAMVLKKKKPMMLYFTVIICAWALGALRVWPIHEPAPMRNQVLINVALLSLAFAVFSQRSRSNETSQGMTVEKII